jgi:CMP-N-acetylneuraminic acid synthetase
MKDLIIVIPVLSNNRHFKDGDLRQISGMTLVEWKINQIKSLIDTYSTYVFVDGKSELSNISDNVKYFEREDESVGSLIAKLKKLFSEKIVLWVNCNAPFVSVDTLLNAIREFEIRRNKYTSLVPVTEDNGFFVLNGEPINFSLSRELSRINNLPLLKLANSFYIFDLDSIQSNLITKNPFYYKVSKSDSYELASDISEADIKNKFLEHLMNNNYK